MSLKNHSLRKDTTVSHDDPDYCTDVTRDVRETSSKHVKFVDYKNETAMLSLCDNAVGINDNKHCPDPEECHFGVVFAEAKQL